MAEALTRYYCGYRLHVDSVGVRHEADEPNPFSIAAMAEIGLDIEHHTPKSMEDLQDKSFDLVITLSPEAHHHALDMTRTLSAEVEYWPTIDPTHVTGNRDAIMTAFRDVREMLAARIRKRFDVTHSPAI